MADDPVLSGIQGGLRGAGPYVIGVLLALALVLHAVFPRYEWRVVGERGDVIVVYDRWSGQYQRAEYRPGGEVVPNHVFVPF